MKRIIKRLTALPLLVALFDDGDGEGDGAGEGDSAGQGAGSAAGGASASTATATAQRNGQSRYSGPSEGVVRDLTTAQQRINELNESDKKRRLENKDLKNTLGTLQSQVELSNRRAIRAEARVALQSAGVIDPDVVDLFLKHAGEVIKVDDSTGDVVGVEESLAKFKEAKPKFFAPADGGQGNGNGQGNGSGNGDSGDGQGSAGAAAGDNADNRGNANGKGASIAGGGTGGGNNTGLPDFRDSKTDPEAALRAYKASLK